jgi:hypothetical protein
MWMPKENRNILPMPFLSGAVSANMQVVGLVVRPPQCQKRSGQSPNDTREVVLFRIQADSGQMINCRLEGTLAGLLEQGDRVTVIGTISQGVLLARTIADEQGSVIGQAETTCFVATAACGDPLAPEILYLRCFRDQRLKSTSIGRRFIVWYNHWGPSAARIIKHRPMLRQIVRWTVIRPLSVLAHFYIRNT